MSRNSLRWMIGSIALLGLTTGALAQEGAESPTAVAVTMPSEHRQLSFQVPGVLAEVPVKEGDIVKVGDPLMKQDDRLEAAILEALQLEANSTLPVEFAEADLENKRVELRRVEQLFQMDRTASQTELDRARLEVKQAEIRLKLAHQESSQKKLEAKAQEIKILQKHLNSPIDGVVEALQLNVGEVIDPQKPAMVVVKNNPLHVDVYLPNWQADMLKVGETMKVSYRDDAESQTAEIIFMGAVAESGSDSRLVRMQMPNPTNKPSGRQVTVQLPEKLLTRQPLEAAQAGN